MGALLRRMPGAKMLSVLFTTPDPKLVRRYGIAIVLILGLPKIVWDVWRLRASHFAKSKNPDNEDLLMQKDPIIKVLRITVKKAVVELRDAWQICFMQYCDAAPSLNNQVRKLLQEAEELVKAGDEEKDEQEIHENQEKIETETPSFRTDDKDSGVVSKVEDSFFAQWNSTLEKVIVYPLSEALNTKEEDPMEEAEIREMAASLLYLNVILNTILKTQRRKNAFVKYKSAMSEHASAVSSLEYAMSEVGRTDHSVDCHSSLKTAKSSAEDRSFGALNLRTPSAIKSVATAANVDSTIVDRLTKTIDEMNRARANLEKQSKRKSTYVSQEAERLEVEAFYWWVSAAEMNEALSALSTSGRSIKGDKLKVSYEHACLWSSPEWNEFRLQMHAEQFPRKHGKELQATLMLCGIESHLLLQDIDVVIGGVKKERFVKLLQFIYHDLCGSWHQRALIVMAWILGAIKTVTRTAEGYYRTNLLMKSVENVVLHKMGRGKKNADLMTVCVGIVVLNFSGVLLQDLLRKVKNAGQGSIRAGLSRKLMHHVLSQDLDDVISSKGRRGRGGGEPAPAELIGSLQDEHQWSNSLGSLLLIPQELISTCTKLLSSGLLLWRKSPQLLFSVILAVLARKRVMRWTKRLEKWCTKLAGLDKQRWDGWLQNYSVTQALDNFEDMRVNAKEFGILEEAEKAQEKAEAETMNQRLIPSFFQPINTFLIDMPTIVGAYVGGILAQSGIVSVSDLAGFTFASAELVNEWNRFRRTISGLASLTDSRFEHGFAIQDIFDQQPKIGIDGGFKEVGSHLKGSIEFRNVSFKYKGMQSSMLKGLNFSIPAGAFVGICGERGAGKTTIFNLIMRLYDVQEGEVMVGGHPINYYNPVWLRRQIGISKQNPVIFNYKTLRENVMYGSESKVRELGGPLAVDEFIERVLKKANIWHHFQNKEKFPQGLATCCYKLSGGERRSVGTARALLSMPSILLLDEPTEGLDAKSERKVMQNIVEMRPKGQTVLAIAHRLSSIRDADIIIFLGEDGSIKEIGPWNKLVGIPGGHFAEFRLAQNLNGPLDAEAKVETTNLSPAIQDIQSAVVPTSSSLSSSELVSINKAATTDTQNYQLDNNLDSGHSNDGSVTSSQNIRHSIESQGEQDEIQRAVEAMRDLRKLASAEAVPFDLVKSLTDACDKVLDYQRVADMAARSAATWKPYHSLQESERLFSSPQELVTSLRTSSVKSSSRLRSTRHSKDGHVGNTMSYRQPRRYVSHDMAPPALTRSRSSGRHGINTSQRAPSRSSS